MELKEIQKAIDRWIKDYGVRYFDEKTNMLLLMEETGELARLIARKYGEQSFKKPLSGKEIKEKIQDEMADILFVLLCLANQMDIDMQEAILKNLDKKTERDKLRHKKNPKLKG